MKTRNHQNRQMPILVIPYEGLILQPLFYGNGEDGFVLCRYLDETHARIDSVDYLIREFVQRMERNGISYAAA